MRIGSVIFLAAIATVLLCAQERAGNQIFRIPQGWIRVDSQGVTMLSPAAEPKNYVVVMLGSFPMGDDFRATFDKNVAGMNGTLRVVKTGEVQSRHTPEGVDLLATTVELQGPTGPRSARYYMAANARGRFEMIT